MPLLSNGQKSCRSGLAMWSHARVAIKERCWEWMQEQFWTGCTFSRQAWSVLRGLNDTPKIAALLLLAPALGGFGSTSLVGIAIAIGGIMSARRVAETMSQKITSMNHGQGFTANFITSLIVIGASRLGLPVSTTHVSCGSLFGIGTITRQAHWSMIGKILGAWLITLPMGATLGAACYWCIRAF